MPTNYWEVFFAHELHELTRRLCATGMATGSVALIFTNAMRGGCLGHVLWRSAFQARRPRRAYPRTSSPVTIATLCTAFQADRPQRNIIAHELHEWTRRLCDTRMATGSVALIYTNAMRGYMTTTGTTWDNLKLSFAGAISNE